MGAQETTVDAAVATVLADPRFESALVSYCARMTSLYRSEPAAVRMMADLGRFAIIAAVVAGPPPVTAAAIARAADGGLAGRKRVLAHLSVLKRLGAVEEVPSTGDRRARPLRATPWLSDWMRRWLEAMISPALAFDPALDAPPLDREETAIAYLRQVLAAHRAGYSVFATLPAVGRLMTLSCGHLLLLELLSRAPAASRPATSFAFSRSSFAHSYGVSRVHAVDLVREAEAQGWLVRAGAEVVLGEAFHAEARRWVAVHFVLASRTLRGALLDSVHPPRAA